MSTSARGGIFPSQNRPVARAAALAGLPGMLPGQGGVAQPAPAPNTSSTPASPASNAKPPATEALARRTGALINEVDFPGFVSQLLHGTFDAIVDASIRQMESYASLVSAVAKTVDQFTEDNVTPNQARDWLAQRYPTDVHVLLPTADQPQPRLVPNGEGLKPGWLADYGLADQELTPELLEDMVLPQVRSKVGSDRQQLLAAMVMLGMNRVQVKDGSISAKVMFRAAASDVAKVGYATGADPQAVDKWGERGASTYGGASTMVSTLNVNAQSETNLRADLFGEVKLNFASESLPLDKLVDQAKIAMVQRHAPGMRSAPAAAPVAPVAPAPAATRGGA